MKLGYGRGYVELSSEGAEIVLPQELPAADAGEVKRSLDQPISRSLQDFESCKSASILVSDITRPAPSHLMLPPLIRGSRRWASPIIMVFGLGTHRRMTPDEERLLLKDFMSVPHMQHDSERCITLGHTARGTPVEILEEVASSDLIVATGNIEYHYYAGYSGGAKALLPGSARSAPW